MVFEEKPAIIGHRGCGSGPDENTIPALLDAVDAGLDWIEIDVQRTAADTLVLRHDPTGPDGAFVYDAPGSLTRLEEVFDAVPTSVGIDVDVKTILEDALDPRTAPLLTPLLLAEARRRRLIVTSFDPALLSALPREIPRGLLTWIRFPIGHAIAAAAGLGLDAVGLHTGSCDPDPRQRPFEECLEVAHRAGLEVIVWCPTDFDPYKGADAFVINDVRKPEEAVV